MRVRSTLNDPYRLAYELYFSNLTLRLQGFRNLRKNMAVVPAAAIRIKQLCKLLLLNLGSLPRPNIMINNAAILRSLVVSNASKHNERNFKDGGATYEQS